MPGEDLLERRTAPRRGRFARRELLERWTPREKLEPRNSTLSAGRHADPGRALIELGTAYGGMLFLFTRVAVPDTTTPRTCCIDRQDLLTNFWNWS
jgi:hypothetical protein